MVNAFTEFLVERAEQKKLSAPADLARATNLSRQVCWNWLTDDREKLTRLPSRSTLEAFAKALGVSFELLLGKAVEALGVGYTSGDFVNGVSMASDRELLDEIERRLLQGGGAHAGSAAPNTPADSGPHLLAVASGDEGDEELAREATEAARKARREQLDAIEEMKRKKPRRKE